MEVKLEYVVQEQQQTIAQLTNQLISVKALVRQYQHEIEQSEKKEDLLDK